MVPMGILHKSLRQRGITPIVGEILMIAIIVVAMGIIAAFVIREDTPDRFYDLEVRLENAAPPGPDNTFDSVRVILRHRGGDPLGIPKGPDDEFRVTGYDL